jgi:hypothetical protein
MPPVVHAAAPGGSCSGSRAGSERAATTDNVGLDRVAGGGLFAVRASCTASTAMASVCSLAGKCKRADRKHRLVEPDEVNNSRRATFGACKLTKEAPPNLSADYLYPRQTAVVKEATETARNSVPSGGHSSSYLCQQDSVFAARDRFPGHARW